MPWKQTPITCPCFYPPLVRHDHNNSKLTLGGKKKKPDRAKILGQYSNEPLNLLELKASCNNDTLVINSICALLNIRQELTFNLALTYTQRQRAICADYNLQDGKCAVNGTPAQ